MYCPRCGQQPAYESNGAPASPGPRQAAGDGPKRLGMRQGAKLMLFSLVSLPLFFAACFPFDSPVPLLVPLTILLSGLAWLSYYKVFGADLSEAPEQKAIKPPAAVNLLRQPEPYAAPVSHEPQSVTEPTTRFFHRT
jgi:hypothetical protein